MIEGHCTDSPHVGQPPSTTPSGVSASDRRMPGLDDVEHECWSHFTEATTRLGDILQRTLVQAHNLTLFDMMLLGILAKSDDGSARMGDLAGALVLIPSRVTQLASRLEARGLLTRSASRSDRRGVIATITPAGRARLKPALQTYAGIVRAYYLVPLSRQQMTALGDSCRRISGGLKQGGRQARAQHG